jgi:hypothetical protein
MMQSRQPSFGVAPRLSPTWLALPILAPLLVGCAQGPEGCDPTQTTFISGIACSMNSGYANRQASLATRRNQAQVQAATSRDNAASAEASRDSALAGQAAAQRRLDQQNAELRQQLARVDRARREYGAADQRVRKAQAALERAEQLQRQGGTSQAALAERERAQREVSRSLDVITGF